MGISVNGDVLDGVGATCLWTLRNRAVEAMHPRSRFNDPWSVRLYQSIKYDYERFGRPSQGHALRAKAIDIALLTYLSDHPRATVVALGEGLQSTYWRVNRPDVEWLSVDERPVLDLRESLLPSEPRITPVATSALDRSWMDRVDPSDGVFITAEGLFMYLRPAEVMSLIAACARRFPSGQLMFDSIPAWLSRRTLAGMKLSDRYTAPPMPFSMTVSQAARLAGEVPGIATAREVPLPAGRGLWGVRPLRALSNLTPLREHRPSVQLVTFTGTRSESR